MARYINGNYVEKGDTVIALHGPHEEYEVVDFSISPGNNNIIIRNIRNGKFEHTTTTYVHEVKKGGNKRKNEGMRRKTYQKRSNKRKSRKSK